MEIRDNVLYTETHEWVLKKDGTARIGVTDHAQETLTDVVFVELPDVGKEFKKGDVLATLESVKSVAEAVVIVKPPSSLNNSSRSTTSSLVLPLFL